MSEHTKTPWNYQGHLIFAAATHGEPFITCEAREEMIANAAHIVKCVNMHDELVEALERTNAWIEDDGHNGGNKYCPKCIAARSVNHLLARTKETV